MAAGCSQEKYRRIDSFFRPKSNAACRNNNDDSNTNNNQLSGDTVDNQKDRSLSSSACTCSNNNDGKVGNNTNESQLHDTDSLDEKKRQSSPCVKWSDKQLKDFIHTEWPNEVVHNVTLFGTNCVCLSKKEQRRLVEKEQNKKKPDKFQHDWLNEANWPIVYVEEKGFYCVI